MADSLVPDDPQDFNRCAQLLYSETFGGLNPLTASHVFRVLLQAGEEQAHGGAGFLAFFAIIWPLGRNFPDRLTIGARVEPWDVNAYVTAKCLLPIRTLQTIIARRANLFEAIAANVESLKRLAKEKNSPDQWLFDSELDALSSNLSHLARLSINRTAIAECAELVDKAAERTPHDGRAVPTNEAVYKDVLTYLVSALAAIRKTSGEVLTNARSMVDSIETRLLKPLKRLSDQKNGGATKAASFYEKLIREPLRLQFAEEQLENIEYWRDLWQAAEQSLMVCREALKELEVACQICPQLADVQTNDTASDDLADKIIQALRDLATANRRVSEVLGQPIKDPALWCRSVVDREIAHASAQNVTDFDPCELVSAIAVAVRWKLMTTPLQVSDAISKAIVGARKDGSWRSGKPLYSSNYAAGIWAPTSDIVGTLASAIEQFPEVSDADQALFNYVDWLERTQIRIDMTPSVKAMPVTAKSVIGWASERIRDRRKIHLGTTALSINALLEVRNLVEYRLWQLCKMRFTVIANDKTLREIDPVDLGATHSKRLHRRLAKMARDAQSEGYKDAEYSLVLHGPPGSSKTKLAEALSAEMWESSPNWGPRERRLIRITPADFTRLGEDRLASEARAIFDLISHVRTVTIFFDEIDDLLRQRSRERPRFMDLVVPAMLNRLADLRSACPRQEICFLLATNYVENIDSALIRKGRIDDSIPVVYPDFRSRMGIISGYVKKVGTEAVVEFLDRPEQCSKLAELTAGWPHSAITAVCGAIARQLEGKTESFPKILETSIQNYESGFSKPQYDQRWDGQRFSQELLNEYFHHLISQPESGSDAKLLFGRQTNTKHNIIQSFKKVDTASDSTEDSMAAETNGEKRLNDKLLKMLDSLLEKEGRV